jgi:hypothetical protein
MEMLNSWLLRGVGLLRCIVNLTISIYQFVRMVCYEEMLSPVHVMISSMWLGVGGSNSGAEPYVKKFIESLDTF